MRTQNRRPTPTVFSSRTRTTVVAVIAYPWVRRAYRSVCAALSTAFLLLVAIVYVYPIASLLVGLCVLALWAIARSRASARVVAQDARARHPVYDRW